MWTERRRAEKHRLCHGPGQRVGDFHRELLRVTWLERQDRTLVGADDCRYELRLERRCQTDCWKLAAIGLVLTADRPAERGAHCFGDGIVVFRNCRGVRDRLEDRDEISDGYALAQQLPEHALHVAD